ncbi:hypothetical protein BKA80DRAFT_300909 [Phyllosticta citrichinensis]
MLLVMLWLSSYQALDVGRDSLVLELLDLCHKARVHHLDLGVVDLTTRLVVSLCFFNPIQPVAQLVVRRLQKFHGGRPLLSLGLDGLDAPEDALGCRPQLFNVPLRLANQLYQTLHGVDSINNGSSATALACRTDVNKLVHLLVKAAKRSAQVLFGGGNGFNPPRILSLHHGLKGIDAVTAVIGWLFCHHSPQRVQQQISYN